MELVKETNRFTLVFFITFIFIGYFGNFIPFLSGLSYIERSIALPILLYGGLIWFYFAVTERNVKETLKLKPISLFNLLLATLVAYAVQPIMSFIAIFFSLFFPNLVEQSISLMEGASFISMLISMAILPALFEEFMLRGIMMTGYRKLGKGKAIVYTAILFGLLHMNPQQVPYAIFAGLVFCYLVDRMGSIWASIIPHFLVNGGSVVSVFLLPMISNGIIEDIEVVYDINTLLYSGLYAVVSIPWLCFLLYLVDRYNPPIDDEIYFDEYEFEDVYYAFEKETQKQLLSPSFNPEESLIEYSDFHNDYINNTVPKFLTWEIVVVLVLFVIYGIVPYV